MKDGRIILVPIEPLEERYSKQWTVWFECRMIEKGIPYMVVNGEPLTSKIEHGAFLDVVGTNYWKSCQLRELCRLIHEGVITKNDTILFHDLWFPGLEMLFYIRDGLGIDFKIAGCVHAGTYDPWDFLSKMGMGSWGCHIEQGWFTGVDRIYVATAFHKHLLVARGRCLPSKVCVSGFPIYPQQYADSVMKENLVVFPHRLDEEKDPEAFDALARRFEGSGFRFAKTKELCSTKQEYYVLLHKAKVAVSCAWQETWGIAMQEAVFADCFPIVPSRLSYAEMYPECFQYNNTVELDQLVEECMEGNPVLEEARRQLKHHLIDTGNSALDRMFEDMRRI